MKYEEFNITDSNGKTNCVIRSLCKILNLSYEEVYDELCNVQKELNANSYVDKEVFETYMKNKHINPIDYGKDFKIKDLKLDKGSYIVFCYDKKDWYHMICIIDNTIYDKSNECMELYAIKVYMKDYIGEERDLYNSNLEKTNKTYFKGEEVPDGYYPMVVMVAIENSKGEFLMQKRSLRKGGDWGITGGHPKAGETPIEGIITEVKEELGIDIEEKDVVEFASGCDGKDCYRMYYMNKDIDLNDITIQEEELTEVKYFTMKQLEEMVEKNELNKDQVAFFKKCKDYIENK